MCRIATVYVDTFPASHSTVSKWAAEKKARHRYSDSDHKLLADLETSHLVGPWMCDALSVVASHHHFAQVASRQLIVELGQVDHGARPLGQLDNVRPAHYLDVPHRDSHAAPAGGR